jgi:hypothetical protein
MALFVPVIIGLPIGYFTWAKVFDTVDNSVYQITQKSSTTSNQGINIHYDLRHVH